jgi:hypothetical protein
MMNTVFWDATPCSQNFTNVSVERIGSVFRIAGLAKQRNQKIAIFHFILGGCLLGLPLKSEDRGSMLLEMSVKFY